MRHDEESAKTNETWEAVPQRTQRQTPHIARLGLPQNAGVNGIRCRTMRREDARKESVIAGKTLERGEDARRREKRQAASDKRRYTHFWRHLKPHMGPPLTWFSSCFSWAPHRRNSVCDILTQLPCDIYSAILHALSSLRHLLYPL